MDLNQEVRFRVETIDFPPLPTEVQKAKEEIKREHQQQHCHQHGPACNEHAHNAAIKELASYAPMLITGTMSADGLGLCSWWEE